MNSSSIEKVKRRLKEIGPERAGAHQKVEGAEGRQDQGSAGRKPWKVIMLLDFMLMLANMRNMRNHTLMA
jgi:hypothetical protein